MVNRLRCGWLEIERKKEKRYLPKLSFLIRLVRPYAAVSAGGRDIIDSRDRSEDSWYRERNRVAWNTPAASSGGHFLQKEEKEELGDHESECRPDVDFFHNGAISNGDIERFEVKIVLTVWND